MGQAKVAILTRFTGLNVEKMTLLRRELRKAAVNYQSSRIPFSAWPFGDGQRGAERPHGGARRRSLERGRARGPRPDSGQVCQGFAGVQILVAASDGKLWGPAEIQAWVNLPSLEGLRAKIMGLIQAPATTLARLTVPRPRRSPRCSKPAASRTNLQPMIFRDQKFILKERQNG